MTTHSQRQVFTPLLLALIALGPTLQCPLGIVLLCCSLAVVLKAFLVSS